MVEALTTIHGIAFLSFPAPAECGSEDRDGGGGLGGSGVGGGGAGGLGRGGLSFMIGNHCIPLGFPSHSYKTDSPDVFGLGL